MILNTLMHGVRLVAAEKDWSMEPFEEICAKIVEAGYKNEWVWYRKKPVKSPDKKHVAVVFLQHEIRYIDISIIIYNKDGEEMVNEKIITEEPNEWVYANHLGNIQWIDNRKVALVNIDKDAEWIVSLS